MIDGVHIWRAALDEAGWPGAEGLPAPERDRAASFLREDARRRWVAARWALRRVLEKYLEEPAAEIELEVDGAGKPRLRDAGGIAFNLSHSNGLGLVAVADGCEVGVDVELIDPDRRAAAASARPVAFYATWTHREARFKCLGSDASGAVAVAGIDVAPEYAAAVAVARAEVGPVDCRSLRAG